MRVFHALLGLVPFTSLFAHAADEPVSVPNQYVVKMTANMPEAQFNHTMGLVRATLGNAGQVGYEYNFGSFQGFSFEAPANLVNAISTIPGVALLHPNYAHHQLHQDNRRMSFDPTGYALDRISHRQRQAVAGRTAPEFVYYLPDGQYTTIFVVDGGIRISHEDFGGRAVKGANFAPNNVLAGHPPHADNDYTNHGTGVAAMAAGTRYGAAKQANIVDVRVFNDVGRTSIADEVAGINFVLNRAQRDNRVSSSVMNLSLGGRAGAQTEVLTEAVQSAINAGMFTTVSAGNDRANADDYVPANVADACTIGGTNSTDGEYYYSNYGESVDLFAPGDNIILPSNASDTATSPKFGTSFSAPLVAGIGAIFKSYGNNYNTYTPVQLCNFLVQTSTRNAIMFSNYGGDYPGPNNLLYYGA